MSTTKIVSIICFCILSCKICVGAAYEVNETPVQFDESSVSFPTQPVETAYPDLGAAHSTDAFGISNWISGHEHILFSGRDLTYNENTTVSGTWDNSGAKLTIKLYRYTADGTWVLQQMNTNLSNGGSTVVTAYGTGRFKLTATTSAPIAWGTIRVIYHT